MSVKRPLVVVVIVVFGLEACFGEGFGRGVVDADAASAAGLDDGRVDRLVCLDVL